MTLLLKEQMNQRSICRSDLLTWTNKTSFTFFLLVKQKQLFLFYCVHSL